MHLLDSIEEEPKELSYNTDATTGKNLAQIVADAPLARIATVRFKNSLMLSEKE